MAHPPPTAPLLKYVVGIDIAKDTFVACLGSLDTAQGQRFYGKPTTFANDAAGFAALRAWVAGRPQLAVPCGYAVEATGIYYEELAYYLADQQQALSVLLPHKVKHFARSTAVKSKTDALDARLLCQLGLERQLPPWQPLTPAMRQLRFLTRERAGLRRQASPLKSRLHAHRHTHQPDPLAQARLRRQLAWLDELVAEIDAQLAQVVAAEPELARKLAYLTSVPGIGLVSACIIVAETSGFVLVENERQLASYAGLDVVQRQSGATARTTSVSKRGNARLRMALYLPAVSSLTHNVQQKAFYARIRARQPAGKVGVVAVMRKLLLLTYALWKNERGYDPAHQPTGRRKVAPALLMQAGATQDAPQSESLLQVRQR